MKISGTYSLPIPPDRAYTLLQDPTLLAQCIPGCEELVEIAPNEYAMKMKMALAAVSGLFDGKVRIADQNPLSSFRLIVEGQGKIGHMKGEGAISLNGADATVTEVHYDGEVHVGGTIAAVGSRLVDTTAKLMIKKFFEKFSSLVA